MIIFKGKKAKQGPVKTSDIKLSDIREVFFPSNFYEKYRYLGCVPYDNEGDIFKALEPLIIFMDYKAKPKWCPRWFLRFLHLFGNDNSIVRMRNWKLAMLHRKLTKGIFMWDYKTKWQWYDLRISVTGDTQIDNLANMIENNYYQKGERQDLIEAILKLDPEFTQTYWSLDKLQAKLDELEGDQSN
jgi:hypothetical protein